jgi:hypothetical protein
MTRFRYDPDVSPDPEAWLVLSESPDADIRGSGAVKVVS